MSDVSREIMRAVLEARDHRHNETHAALLAAYQALVAELIDAGAVKAEPLRQRLELMRGEISGAAHGEAARAIFAHILAWLENMPADLPVPHPKRWTAPPIPWTSAATDN